MTARRGRYTTPNTQSSRAQTVITQKRTVGSVILPTEDAAGLVQRLFIRATAPDNERTAMNIMSWVIGALFLFAFLGSLTKPS